MQTDVTYSDIETICKTLVISDQSRITTRAVREKLGRGSLSTISKHLKKWQENNHTVTEHTEKKIRGSATVRQLFENKEASSVHPQEECTPCTEDSVEQKEDDSHTSIYQPKSRAKQGRLFLSFLSEDVTSLLLITMIGALSYLLITFQIRAYAQLPEFKGLQNITAVSVEILLLVFSALSMHGKTMHRLAATFLFISLSASTVYLLHRNTQSEGLAKTEKLNSDESKSMSNNEEVKSNKEEIARYTSKISILLLQLDPTKHNTYAGKGENGNIKNTNLEISEAEKKIEALKGELKLLERASEPKKLLEIQTTLVTQDTYFHLILRVLLLLTSAFLVHIVLRRFDAWYLNSKVLGSRD